MQDRGREKIFRRNQGKVEKLWLKSFPDIRTAKGEPFYENPFSDLEKGYQ